MRGAGGATRVASIDAGKLRLMRRPQRARHRIVGVGERVGEGRGGPMRDPGIPVESCRDVTRGRPAKPEERRERDKKSEGKQDDARNPQGARRKEPRA